MLIKPPPFKALRAAYPTPRRGRDDDYSPDSYCVGGALCMQMKLNGCRFPTPITLAECLYSATNGQRDEFESAVLADEILKANDSGDFERAWTALAGALGDEYR